MNGVLLGVFLFSVLCTKLLIYVAPRLGLVDIPNTRSSHVVATPRGGGLAFVCAFILTGSVALFFEPDTVIFWKMFLPCILVAALGLVDDKKGLSAGVRLLVQFLAAAWSIWLFQQHFQCTFFGFPEVLSCVLALFAIVGSTNFFNFMDGIDGIAGIEAAFIFISLTLLYAFLGIFPMVLLTGAIGVGVLGFLVWNWPPAKIFMGDVGSSFLGCAIAVQALLGEFAFGVPLQLSILLYAVFWFDALVTLVRRVYRRAPFAKAHREHAYQRARALGIPIRTILGAGMVLNTVLWGLAYAVFITPEYFWGALAGALVLLSSCYGYIEWREGRVHDLQVG